MLTMEEVRRLGKEREIQRNVGSGRMKYYKKCECGSLNTDDCIFCPICGTKLLEEWRIVRGNHAQMLKEQRERQQRRISVICCSLSIVAVILSVLSICLIIAHK